MNNETKLTPEKIKTAWIITKEVNAYDQEGAYFIAVFLSKPTRAQILKLFYGGDGENKNYVTKQQAFASHLLKGGGRIDVERSWYYIREVGEGVNCDED